MARQRREKPRRARKPDSPARASSPAAPNLAHGLLVSPPIPAPYLEGAKSLDDSLAYGGPIGASDQELDRDPRRRLEMKKQVNAAARDIIKRRLRYQDEHDVKIEPEEPLAE